MKKMIKWILFVVILISQNGFSQACGGGILIFNIYTLNGVEIEEFDYEIFPVSKELLQEKFYSKVMVKENLNNPNHYLFQKINETGGIIMEQYANEIIDAKNDELNSSLKKILDLSEINKAGKIKSSLSFKTFELANFPIILKISHKEKTIYILGNYFGGCNREASLIWNNGNGKLN
ncbi:hypothetical protein [Flavobacterium sp. LHD-85]|uniref:hypothetical protein n=1 Tax=Flavobacterium sp. LHD-85 TaxID=3071410 RepID=UPI0027E17FC2|nr:hypothetical protein [Flavobacterium sp. LHD-85]MDQ6527726.1 hypothetical protein [Flavobacterium sp. LHD-85]